MEKSILASCVEDKATVASLSTEAMVSSNCDSVLGIRYQVIIVYVG